MSANQLKVFTDIGHLLTLEGAAKKTGRSVGEADLTIINDAFMIVNQGKIQWVGARPDFDPKTLPGPAEYISLQGKTVLPSFVEPHTHLIFAGNRAHEFEWRIQGQSYQEIAAKGGGIRFTVDQTRRASVTELSQLAQHRANVFLRQGVTTLEVKSGYGLDLETELRSLKVARALVGPKIVTTYLGAHSRSPDHPDFDTYLEQICTEILPRIAREKLADRVDIYIERGFFTLEQAKTYVRKAVELGFQITGHVEQLSEMGGADLMLDYAPQSLDHVVFVTDETIQKMARSETTAVLLPSSDFYLKMRYPRARTMLDSGVRVALSTDFNPGTSPTQELSLVGVLARLEMKMTLPEVIVAQTLGAAYALGEQARVGSLSLGKDCDFSVLEGSWRDLFYSVGHHPIAQVFKAGERLI